MDTYENIVIGNFLFGFGAALGHYSLQAGRCLETIVDLLQQTRFDGPLGDLLVRNAYLMRLMEFKRASNADNKEWRKLTALQRR